MNEPDQFKPDPDEVKRLDPRRMAVSYDRASDTLMVHFIGTPLPAVTVPLPRTLARDFVFLRFDPETRELVGLQIEDFVNLYLPGHPRDAVLLQRAALCGITRDEVAEICRRVEQARPSPVPPTVFEDLAQMSA